MTDRLTAEAQAALDAVRIALENSRSCILASQIFVAGSRRWQASAVHDGNEKTLKQIDAALENLDARLKVLEAASH